PRSPPSSRCTSSPTRSADRRYRPRRRSRRRRRRRAGVTAAWRRSVAGRAVEDGFDVVAVRVVDVGAVVPAGVLVAYPWAGPVGTPVGQRRGVERLDRFPALRDEGDVRGRRRRYLTGRDDREVVDSGYPVGGALDVAGTEPGEAERGQ